MRVDVIIPAKSRPDLTAQAVDSLFKNVPSESFRLILRLEEGDEELLPLAPEWEKRGVHVVVGPKPSGFATLVNECAKVAESEVVILMNSDVVLESNVVAAMLPHFEDPEVGIVGAKLLFAVDKQEGRARTIQHVGCVMSPEMGMSHVGVGYPEAMYQYCKPMDGVTFALVGIRRRLLVEPLPTPEGPMTGLDESMGWGGVEDTDFCIRVSEAGFKVIYCADAVALHYESAVRFHLLGKRVTMNVLWGNLMRLRKRWGEVLERKSLEARA